KATGIDFRIGGNKAFYMPSLDYIQVPPPSAFFEPINWHRTALHEVSHASGHHSRLNRDMTGSFGSKPYFFEECVAEISSAFCCAAMGIVPTVKDDDSDVVKPLPERLMAELTAHRTLALRDALGSNPHVALAALLHKLVRDSFGCSTTGSAMGASV